MILDRNSIEVKDWTDTIPRTVYEFSVEKRMEKMMKRPLPDKKVVITKTILLPPTNIHKGRKHRNQLMSIVQRAKEVINVSANQVETKKEGTVKNKHHEYEPSLFRCGAKLTVEGLGTINMGGTSTEFIGYVQGHLHERPELNVRVFFIEKQRELFTKLTHEPNEIFTATVVSVFSKDGKIVRLHMNAAESLISTVDMEGNEVLPDDYTFLNMSCQKCKKTILWDDVPKSRVVIWRLIESAKCTCQNCLPKGS